MGWVRLLERAFAAVLGLRWIRRRLEEARALPPVPLCASQPGPVWCWSQGRRSALVHVPAPVPSCATPAGCAGSEARADDRRRERADAPAAGLLQAHVMGQGLMLAAACRCGVPGRWALCAHSCSCTRAATCSCRQGTSSASSSSRPPGVWPCTPSAGQTHPTASCCASTRCSTGSWQPTLLLTSDSRQQQPSRAEGLRCLYLTCGRSPWAGRRADQHSLMSEG